MSSLNNLFLFIHAERSNSSTSTPTAAATTNIPSPSPTYSGGGTSAERQLPDTKPSKKFSFKSKTQKQQISLQQQQQRQRQQAQASVMLSSPSLASSGLSNDTVPSLFFEALTARATQQLPAAGQASGCSVHPVEFFAVQQIAAQHHDRLRQAVLENPSAAAVSFHRQQQQQQQQQQPQNSDKSEMQTLVDSSLSVPALRRALFKFLRFSDPSTAFHQELLQVTWDRVNDAASASSSSSSGPCRRERGGELGQDTMTAATTTTRVPNFDRLNDAAIHAFVHGLPAARRALVDFAANKEQWNGGAVDHHPPLLVVPAVVEALLTLENNGDIDDDGAECEERMESGEEQGPSLVGTLVRRASRGTTLSEATLSRHLGQCADQQQDQLNTLVLAFRHRLATAIVPDRVMSQLRAVDRTARPLTTTPICARLSIFETEACAEAAQAVQIDADFAGEIAALLQKTLEASPSSGQQVIDIATTALLFTPVTPGEKQAMLQAKETLRAAAAQRGSQQQTSMAKHYQAALAAALMILLPEDQSGAPSRRRNQLVEFIVVTRAVLHAATTNNSSTSKQVDPVSMARLLDSKLFGADSIFANLFIVGGGGVHSFLVQSFVAVVDVIVIAASLQEVQSYEHDQSGDTAAATTATSYLASSLGCQRFLDAIFSSGSTAVQSDLLRTLSNEEEKEDGDEKQQQQQTSTAGLLGNMLSAVRRGGANSQLCVTKLLLQSVRWFRLLLFGIGHSSQDADTDEQRSAKQTALLGRLEALVIDSALGTPQPLLSAGERSLFAGAVLKELLGCSEQEQRVTLQGSLSGEDAQIAMGKIVIMLVREMKSDPVLKVFWQRLSSILAPLLPAADSNELKRVCEK